MQHPVNSRIAPTPSGFLHIGNLASFMLTWLLIKRKRGHLLLRIDDIDKERSRKKYVEDIIGTLQHMGIDYDEGPTNIDNFYLQWSQQLRLTHYQKMLQQLVATGKVFACTCSRKQLQEQPCRCLQHKIPLNTIGCTWKISLPHNSSVSWNDEHLGNTTVMLQEVMTDVTIRRNNGLPAYHIASICDDLLFGINFIIRGEDLLPSTAVQLYLAQLAGHQQFATTRFLHHPLILDADGKKLSKSAGAAAIPRQWSTEIFTQVIEIIAPCLPMHPSCRAATNLQELLQTLQ